MNFGFQITRSKYKVRGDSCRRLLSLLLALVFGLHSTLLVAGPISSQDYQPHVQEFFNGLNPESVWDLPPPSTAGIEEKWAEAIRKEQGEIFANTFSDNQKAEHFDWWIERLRRSAFYGESADPRSPYYINHPLDVFGVLGQAVNTKPVEGRWAKTKRLLGGVTQKVGRGVRAVGSEWANVVRSVALPEMSMSADEVHEESVGQPELKRVPYFDYVDWHKMTVEVVDKNQQVVRRLNPDGKELSFLHGETGAAAGERGFSAPPGADFGKNSFNLSYQGQVLHEFKNNISSIVAVGRYLVFLEPSRTSPSLGLVNLSFIDLDFFHSALGKTVLPIFRVPVKLGEAAARAPGGLRIQATSEGVQIDDKLISLEVFEFFSWMQQLAYNTTVSLVDARFYSSTSKVLESMITEFDRSLVENAQNMKGQMDRAGIPFELFAKFKDELNSQLRTRAQVGAVGTAPRKELEQVQGRLATQGLRDFDKQHVGDKDLEVPEYTKARLQAARNQADQISSDVKGHLARVQRFGQGLVADQAFQSMLTSYNQTIESQRRLINRTNLYLARMFAAQPLGAPKIQQALGMVAAGVTSKDSWKDGGAQACAIGKEAVLEIFANRKARLALEVMVGATLCSVYPAESAQFFFQSLDVARTTLDWFAGWSSDWVSIAKTTWSASWQWLPWVNPHLLWETYVQKDRFKKLTIGVSAIYGALLATAGTLHTVVNSYHYAKALHQGGWKEQRDQWLGFWRSLKQSFITYVDRDRKKYNEALARSERRRRGQDIKIVLADGTDFKGIFRSTADNDFAALAEAERNGRAFEVIYALPTGQLLRGQAKPAGSAAGPTAVRLEMDLPDGGKIQRVIEVTEGDWSPLGKNEGLEEGVGAEIRLAKATLQGRLQNTEWTETEEAELVKLLEQAAASDSEMMKKLEVIKKIPGIASLFNGNKADIETLGKALRHFIFGYSSWTHSTRLFGQIWNPWFLFRNFWTRPRALFTMLAYPAVFNRMVWNNGVATYFDGGKTPVWEARWLRRLGSKAMRAGGLGSYVGPDSLLDDLAAFEKQVIPVEQVLHQAAMRRAFLKLTEISAHDPDFIRLLSQGGKIHPFDPKFKTLNKKLRIYFESYFTNAFNEALRLHLTRVVGRELPEAVTDKELKREAAASHAKMELTEAQAEQLVAEAIEKFGVAEKAKVAAEEFWAAPRERTKLDHWRKVGLAMDANFNYSLNRYKTAATQMDNEEAMARATRQYMVALVVDKPIELLFTFLFLAGIEEGVLKPLHDEAFGPDSAFYLSRYVFWNGYFVGIMMSLLADVWMKIQTDARIDSLGGFNDVPTPEEYKKGYVSWFKKQFNAPDNKWWDNQKYEMKLSFINMPAYFLTALVSNLMTLKRFDLDGFLSVYKGAFLPSGGLAFKLDQANEKAANYSIGGIPAKYHVDPRVQEMRNRVVGQYRFRWNLVYKTIYENPLGNLLGNWMMIPVEGIGPRAWMRMWYPGKQLPTELLANNVLHPLEAANIKGVSAVASACDTLLTTNHTDAVKLKPRPIRAK